MAFPMDDSKIQRHKGYGKKIFLIGSGLLLGGIAIFLLNWRVNNSCQDVGDFEKSCFAIAQFSIFAMITGVVTVIIGGMKWPSRERSPREKKVLDVAVLTIFFILIGLSIGFFVFSGMECLQVKNDYQNDPEFAQEQYGYVTFEQWLEGNGRKYAKNCMPDIDFGLIPG